MNWQTNSSPFPHYWQVDLGRICYNICKFCFNPIDDRIAVLVRSYELSYSLDGTNFTKIYSNTYIPKELVMDNTYQAEECEFNPINLRYFRITIFNTYDTRGYTWVGFKNALLYADVNTAFYLKESDNNIYGFLDNEIKQITTLDIWNNLSKEEKENLIQPTHFISSINQLKSLNKFKIISLKEGN